jgi:hypothetical protein
VAGVEFTYGSIIVHFSGKVDMIELNAVFKRLLHELELDRRALQRKLGKIPEATTKVIGDPRAVSWLM